MTATGGVSTTGGMTATGGTTGSGGDAGTEAFSFYVFGDAHAGQSLQSGQTETANTTIETAMNQMHLIDPDVIGAFSNGDLVDDATSADWTVIDNLTAIPGFHGSVSSFGPQARLLGILGNHDTGYLVPTADWLTYWNQHLSGQQALGHNGTDGVFYSVSYANVLFIALDSEHISAAQTNWLKTLLASTDAKNAQVKLAFFHEPVYPCTNTFSPKSQELPWVDLFENNGVKLVFVSHVHAYSRTCPMVRGACRTDGTGVTYQQVGPVGAHNYHPLDRSTGTATGIDSTSAARTDNYSCTGTNGILKNSRANVNDFCHVRVSGCRVIGDCYLVASGGTTPFDSWEVNGCE
jgi:hypothetical protein